MLQLAPGDEVAGYALIRYRLPVDAVLIVFTGLAIVDLWARLSRSSLSPGLGDYRMEFLRQNPLILQSRQE